MVIQKVDKTDVFVQHDILEFLSDNFDYDFYITHNNERIYITDSENLRKLYKNTQEIYYIEEDDKVQAIGFVWSSFGGDVSRNYAKMLAVDNEHAKKILTALIWKHKYDLYVKLRNDSRFMDVYKMKGFRYQAGRGFQTLLKRRMDKEIVK